ncbi:MAG: hypothetical protein L0287_33930, partial [Anaerolineae bacterium]|nr:hypothetical protein [Anaerolineae bacterium]
MKISTDSTNPLRFILVSCSEDDWIGQVAADMSAVAHRRHLEFLYLAAGHNRFVKPFEYVPVDLLCRNLDVRSISRPLIYEHANLNSLKALQHQFEQAQAPHLLISMEEVSREVDTWFAEAVCALKLLQPDWGIVWNGHITIRAVYVQALKYLGIPFVYAEKGVLPRSWYLDANGINARSYLRTWSSANGASHIDEWQQRIQHIDQCGESAWEQPQRTDLETLKKGLGVRPDQKIVFFPAQVDSDSNIILFSSHFSNSLEALKWLVDGLPANEYFILVKPH